ncbi:MAG: adenylosuccinate lyase [Candidatus Dormiibacterota bacterium]
MIDRYAPPRMRELWSDEHRFQLWLRVEILAAEGWSELGRVPADALPKIRQATFDVDRINAVEAEVHHDVIAFLTVVNESIGQPEARHVHLGLTSSDVIDTAFAVQCKESAELILEDLRTLRQSAARLAVEHRATVQVGRTHGIHAEPITFGFKVAGWVAELDRAIARVERGRDEVAAGAVSGPVGTHATVDPSVERYVCEHLGLEVDPVSTQIVSRDRHAAYLCSLAVAAASMERIALEIRHLQRSEVAEVMEPFGSRQKVSSAMPHKRNPILTERICGLARTMRGYAATELENVALWHERDISHSSAERIVFPDACCLVDYMAQTLRRVLDGLVVRPEQMARNLEMWGGVVYSQRALLALVDSGMSREEAYRIVQSAALRALDGERGFRANLQADPTVMSRIENQLDAIFDPGAFLRHTDLAFARLGLADDARSTPAAQEVTP